MSACRWASRPYGPGRNSPGTIRSTGKTGRPSRQPETTRSRPIPNPSTIERAEHESDAEFYDRINPGQQSLLGLPPFHDLPGAAVIYDGGPRRPIILEGGLEVKDTRPDSQDLIREVCDEIRDFLVEKNEQYGDSAINPVRIFSKASSTEQLLVRIDDKLSRISRGDDRIESDEDVIDDLIGYLILFKVARRKAGA